MRPYNCPACGHDDIATDATAHRDGIPRIWTCMRCMACWDSEGRAVELPDAIQVDNPWPEWLPVVKAD